jgi:hypothetical protein
VHKKRNARLAEQWGGKGSEQDEGEEMGRVKKILQSPHKFILAYVL